MFLPKLEEVVFPPLLDVLLIGLPLLDVLLVVLLIGLLPMVVLLTRRLLPAVDGVALAEEVG